MRMIPMPSPNNTNIELRFVPARFASPTVAMDAADPADLEGHEEEKRRESCTALLRRIDAALAERLDGRGRNEVMALVHHLAGLATGEPGDPHAVMPEAGDQGPPPRLGAPPMGGMGGRLTADEVDEWKRFLESKGLSSADIETAVRLLGATEGEFLSGARPMVGGGIAVDAILRNPYYGSVVVHRPRGLPPGGRAAADRAVALASRIGVDVFEAGRLAAAARPEPSARRRTSEPLAMDTSSAASDDYARMFPGAARIGKLD